MAIPQLTDEQVRTWSIQEKDRWWLTNVFRGDMPQLTLRSALTGFLLGGVLSATNLYVGAKTGWTLGVGLTSVILAFAAFRIMSRLGARDMTILENNCSQSIATAAGYMTGPLISGMAAYMWIENKPMPLYQMFWFNVVLSILGVLVAFPMKRRFINDEQQPFPEGRAAGVVLDTLYTADARSGMFQAKVLAAAALVAGAISFVAGEAYMKFIQWKVLGLDTARWMSTHLDNWYYALAERNLVPTPAVWGVPLRPLGISFTLDLAMIGAGGLMGIRPALNMLLGVILNFVIVVPWMISIGEIQANPDGAYTRTWVLNTWALWWGIAIMVVAALVGLFAKPKVIIGAFTNLLKKDRSATSSDVLRHIELPLWISFVGVPIVGAVGVWMAHEWFDVYWWHGALAIPLIIALTMIAANSTALTGITPTGSLSKIPQFLFGFARPKHPATNLMTAVMCVEVAGNASNLLMDIKPGYMLGAKPRQQAIGHMIGIIAGALASTPLFGVLFLSEWKKNPALSIEEAMVSDQFGFPSAFQWKGIAQLISDGLSSLPASAQWSMLIAAVVGIAFEIARIASRNKFPISPLAIGLGVVVPPESVFAMCMGAGFFWIMGRIYNPRSGRDGQGGGGAEHGRVEGQLGGAAPGRSLGHRLWVGSQEPICAGLIAGAALVGIGDILVRVFLLD